MIVLVYKLLFLISPQILLKWKKLMYLQWQYVYSCEHSFSEICLVFCCYILSLTLDNVLTCHIQLDNIKLSLLPS